MRFYHLLSRFSVIGGFTLLLVVLIFGKNFSPNTKLIMGFILVLSSVTFLITEILKRLAKKKYKNKHL